MVAVRTEPTEEVADDGSLVGIPPAGSMPPLIVEAGCMIGDRYRLDALLATGGMGQVWRGRDLVLDRLVAVKVLRPEHTGDSAALARFRAEARLTAGLAHPNIAALHDYGEAASARLGRRERLAYLVMELVEGETLSAVLQREGRLPPARTLEIIRQSAAGLAAAHAAGVVHRDVKPGNLMLGPDGTVTITDFGIAWTEARDPLTLTGQVMGTAQYLSPEQAQGGRVGPASDVYALGVVAYECLAGRRAFDGESPLQTALMHVHQTPEPLPPDVPREVQELVNRVLMKDPEKRFPDGAALLSAVETVIAGRSLPRQPDRQATTALRVADRRSEPERRGARRARSGPSLGPRHSASGRRSPRKIIVSLIALLVLAAVAAGLVFWTTDAPSAPAAAGTPVPTAVLTIRVTAADYLGRPVAEVEAELTVLGLAVRQRPIQTADALAGEVLAIEPVGQLAPGQLVVVTPAVAPAVDSAPSPAPTGQSGGDVGGAGTGSTPTAPETDSTPETSTTPGNSGSGNGIGNGIGRGNGRVNG